MLKIAVLTGALAIGLVGGAYAQATGPAAQTDNMNNDEHEFQGDETRNDGNVIRRQR